MAIKNKLLRYNYGLIDLEKFPRGKLIKSERNKDFYEVPEGIEVLTSWNGETKWVKPESYSVHKNLKMLRVKTSRGNTIECSNDHSLVTMDDNLNYTRAPAKVGMCIPKLNHAIDNYMDPSNYKRSINIDGIRINLNKDMGYLFGVMIGDGWVNREHKLNDIMVANISLELIDKVTSIFKEYGYTKQPYSLANTHKFEGFECNSRKTTWNFKEFAKLFRKTIGLGAENKHLPSWWRNTSNNFRWGLLSGLVDTDGGVNVINRGNRITFYTCSKQLAYEVVALINSLGGNCGLTIHKRKYKIILEYTLYTSADFNQSLKNNLELYVPIKKEKVNELLYIPNNMEVTPNISINKLKELYSKVYKISSSLTKGRIDQALRLARTYKVGGYFRKPQLLEVLNECWDTIKNDPYWIKLRSILEDENISWEVITDVFKLPEVTEAYDLTTPPYCTFVLQNGIIVYDTVSLNIVYTEDAIKEINELLNSNKYYLSPEGSIAYSADDDVIGLILKHMTDKPSGVDISKE